MLLSRLGAPTAVAHLPRLAAPRPVVLARISAVSALLLLFLGTAAIVIAGKKTLPLSVADGHYINARLVEIDQGVRTRLVRTHSAGSIALARRETAEAIAELGALIRPVQGAAGGAALQRAIVLELRFLDGVGSLLANPRSPLLDRLPALDAQARSAMASLDGPRARRTGGVMAVQRLRSGRAAGRAAA